MKYSILLYHLTSYIKGGESSLHKTIVLFCIHYNFFIELHERYFVYILKKME